MDSRVESLGGMILLVTSLGKEKEQTIMEEDIARKIEIYPKLMQDYLSGAEDMPADLPQLLFSAYEDLLLSVQMK